MYKLKATIKCPTSLKDEMVQAVKNCGVKDIQVDAVPYAEFITESRLYWDYVFPEMKSDEKAVTYISFAFDDTPEGRKASHDCELKIGWIPQNLRYVEVN